MMNKISDLFWIQDVDKHILPFISDFVLLPSSLSFLSHITTHILTQPLLSLGFPHLQRKSVVYKIVYIITLYNHNNKKRCTYKQNMLNSILMVTKSWKLLKSLHEYHFFRQLGSVIAHASVYDCRH